MNKQALSNLIALGEGFTTEFKRTGTSNLGREICAFANATGGIILIGVAEPVIEVSENWVTTTFKRPNGQVEDQVTGEVKQLLHVLTSGPMMRAELQEALACRTID
jgi:predicted HTH transcriptional regulator